MSYMERRAARLAFHRLKKEVGFGMVISSLLLGVGAWRYFVVIGANDRLAAAAAVLGAIGWVLTLVVPSVWSLPEKALGLLVRQVGGALFAALLTLVYGVLMVPVGVLLRAISGPGPIATWDGGAPAGGLEGWRPKEVTCEVQVSRRGKPSLAMRFVAVLQFFVRRGHYVFLPTLVIVLALGLVLFFVKSSALAPFIYTLF